MLKNAVIGALILFVLAEGFLVLRYRNQRNALALNLALVTAPKPSPTGAPRQAPPILSKGDNFASSPLFKFATKIAPGELSGDAQKVMTGFSLTSKKNADGSLTVSLTPKDSDDQSQTYVLKPGNVLYFIEMTPVDDKADVDRDLNYRDDYGIITDSNGIIQ